MDIWPFEFVKTYKFIEQKVKHQVGNIKNFSGQCEISRWNAACDKKSNCIKNNWNNLTEGVERVGAELNNLGNEWNLMKLKAESTAYKHSTVVDKVTFDGNMG